MQLNADFTAGTRSNPRRRLLIAVGLVLLLIVVVGNALLLGRWQDLKSRAVLISKGMPRAQVEDILGPPALVLPRTGDRGFALAWVDQFWQVDVLIDRGGRVESTGRMP
jgi:hypothetical protein